MSVLVQRSDVGEFRRRYKWMVLFTIIAFLALLVRLFQLQIVNGDDYRAEARHNIIYEIRLATTRGIIRDSQGKVHRFRAGEVTLEKSTGKPGVPALP